jgi:chromosome segregation ATPase
MAEKALALRLAQALNNRQECEDDAADELRRLHAENEMLWKEREEPHQKVAMYVRECNRLEDERDELRKVNAELLEALKSTRAFVNSVAPHGGLFERINAAIAKAEGEKE